MTKNVRLRLFEAIANEVVFRHGGLTVLAAPRRFSLGTKLDRIRGVVASPDTLCRDYDVPDAFDYLRRVVLHRGSSLCHGHHSLVGRCIRPGCDGYQNVSHEVGIVAEETKLEDLINAIP